MFKNLLKNIFKVSHKEYNDIENIVNIYETHEPSNPYGHVKEFNKLNKNRKYEAHRVISPLALKLVGIEEIYSVIDINGNTYIFDIFEEGNYRVREIIELKDKMKEVMHGTNINKNS